VWRGKSLVKAPVAKAQSLRRCYFSGHPPGLLA
jgi:hypothetical protein